MKNEFELMQKMISGSIFIFVVKEISCATVPLESEYLCVIFLSFSISHLSAKRPREPGPRKQNRKKRKQEDYVREHKIE